MFNKKWVTFGREPSNVYAVSIASHITEYARFYLWSLMQRIGWQNVLYCDTDSLKIHYRYMKYYKDLIHSTKLGALKLESVSKEFAVYAPKYWVTEDRTRIKGVPKAAERIAEHEYRYSEFKKQATHLRNRITRFFIVAPVTKKVTPYYDKGIVCSDGTIQPLTLSQF
jgi:hypothetical protein